MLNINTTGNSTVSTFKRSKEAITAEMLREILFVTVLLQSVIDLEDVQRLRFISSCSEVENSFAYVKTWHCCTNDFDFVLMNYSKIRRPALNQSDKVKVRLGMTLTQLIDVEETQEHAILNANMRQSWRDPYLVWDPKKFGGISTINVGQTEVWVPDIYLYQNVEDDKSYNGFLDTFKTLIQVFNTGEVRWLAPVIFRINCPIKVIKYPFDTQTCVLKFGSWTYDSGELELIAEKQAVDLSKYSKHIQWKLLSLRAFRSLTRYSCCSEPYTDVTFKIVLKRKPLFLMVNLICPNIIFSFLTVVVFYVPAETCERGTFVISLVLAMALFLTNATSLLPDSSEAIPLFSYFLGLTLLAMFLLTICLCYSLSIYYADAYILVMPRWMRKYILNGLSPFLGVRIRTEEPQWSKKLYEMEALLPRAVNEGLDCCHPGRLWDLKQHRKNRGALWQSHPEEVLTESSLDKYTIKCISQRLTVMIDKVDYEEKISYRKAEWQTVSKTLDKISFWFFLSAYSMICLFCALRAPDWDGEDV